MIHWPSASVAPMETCRAGSATLTTVPSTNAMLDARIVAARIHGSARRAHGAGCFATAAAASLSQGGRTAVAKGGHLQPTSCAIPAGHKLPLSLTPGRGD